MRSQLLSVLFAILFSASASAETVAPINWIDWSEDIFVQASKEKKLVLLNMEAVWCHWCHVMEKKTYSRLRVREVLREKYLAVKVDQDARPDLSNRYRRWGWPATIIFSSSGKELVKLSGFQEADDFSKLLRELATDPTPRRSARAVQVQYSASPILPEEVRKKLVKRYYSTFDSEEGGLKLAKRFLDPDSVEFALIRAKKGMEQDVEIARKTLDANLKLFDPAWGGVYQYSTHYGWDRAHFEKIMVTQYNNLRIYAFGFGVFQEPRYREALESIYKYLTTFLSDAGGAFYTSQDADVIPGQHSGDFFTLGDAARRTRGIPRVDKNRYSRENGWAISGLAAAYAATGKDEYLARAEAAANWILDNRTLSGGGFKHGARDKGGPFLGDSLFMARALLDLFSVTGDRNWLEHAEAAVAFIEENFREQGGETAGYFTTVLKRKNALKPAQRLDENITFARTVNLIKHYTGNEKYKPMAESAMRYIAAPTQAYSTLTEPGVVITADELSSDPLHITVVGHKDDPLAKRLFSAGLRYPCAYKRIEWWDKREGPMPNPDVTYPTMERSAAFICTNQRCSLPIFKADGIAEMIKTLLS